MIDVLAATCATLAVTCAMLAVSCDTLTVTCATLAVTRVVVPIFYCRQQVAKTGIDIQDFRLPSKHVF